MNIMRKLVFLVVILGVIALSVGCQQSALSEEEVRDIVEEEVARQLATTDELTVSNLYIENEDGRIVASLGVEIISGGGELYFSNADGEKVAGLRAGILGDGEFYLSNANGEIVITLESMNGDGFLTINNANGDWLVTIGSSTEGNGMLLIYDKHGRPTFLAP